MNAFYKRSNKLTLEIQYEFRKLYDRLQLHELTFSSMSDDENLKSYQDIAKAWKDLQDKYNVEVSQDSAKYFPSPPRNSTCRQKTT